MAPLHINEFLCFLTVQFDKLDRENLISILVDSYVLGEAIEAKNTLIAECEKISIKDSIKDFSKPRVKGKADALRRVVTDAVDIWTFIDQEKAGVFPVQFVAANPNRIPNASADKFNLHFLVTSILKLQEKVESQDESLLFIKENLVNNCRVT